MTVVADDQLDEHSGKASRVCKVTGLSFRLGNEAPLQAFFVFFFQFLYKNIEIMR
jgi:hypothetical protein